MQNISFKSSHPLPNITDTKIHFNQLEIISRLLCPSTEWINQKILIEKDFSAAIAGTFKQIFAIFERVKQSLFYGIKWKNEITLLKETKDHLLRIKDSIHLWTEPVNSHDFVHQLNVIRSLSQALDYMDSSNPLVLQNQRLIKKIEHEKSHLDHWKSWCRAPIWKTVAATSLAGNLAGVASLCFYLYSNILLKNAPLTTKHSSNLINTTKVLNESTVLSNKNRFALDPYILFDSPLSHKKWTKQLLPDKTFFNPPNTIFDQTLSNMNHMQDCNHFSLIATGALIGGVVTLLGLGALYYYKNRQQEEVKNTPSLINIDGEINRSPIDRLQKINLKTIGKIKDLQSALKSYPKKQKKRLSLLVAKHYQFLAHLAEDSSFGTHPAQRLKRISSNPRDRPIILLFAKSELYHTILSVIDRSKIIFKSKETKKFDNEVRCLAKIEELFIEIFELEQGCSPSSQLKDSFFACDPVIPQRPDRPLQRKEEIEKFTKELVESFNDKLQIRERTLKQHTQDIIMNVKNLKRIIPNPEHTKFLDIEVESDQTHDLLYRLKKIIIF